MNPRTGNALVDTTMTSSNAPLDATAADLRAEIRRLRDALTDAQAETEAVRDRLATAEQLLQECATAIRRADTAYLREVALPLIQQWLAGEAQP